MNRPACCVFGMIFVALLALGTSKARAGCSPFARTVYVGNTALDNQCDYDSIQAAIDSSTCPSTIVITTQRVWSGQHLSIDSQSLTLTGGGGNCGLIINPGVTTGSAPATHVVISGFDGVDASIIDIIGNSHVNLRNLTISGGRDVAYSAMPGGGINFYGRGALTLENVTVSDNYAGFGGGIAMQAVGGHAELELRANSVIRDNKAQMAGGGIYLRFDARLRMLEPQSTIAFNDVLGRDENGNLSWGEGGGLLVIGARAEIGSPGWSPGASGPELASIEGNTAVFGGGVSVRDEVSDGLLRMFPTQANLPPPAISSGAANTGGALLLIHGGTACLFDTNIANNLAGYATAAKVSEGSSLYINTDPSGECDTASLPALGAVPCPLAWSCNRFENNDTTLPYASIDVSGGTFHADRLLLTETDARQAISADAASEPITLRNCLIADNHLDGNALLMANSALDIDHCTFVNNELGTVDHEISTNADIRLQRSIIHEPAGKLALLQDTSTAVVDIHHVLSSDLTTLPSRADIITGDPSFSEASAGNYRLQTDSPALDFAPGSDGKDLDFRPRNVDQSYNANDFGPGDLGAYERQLQGAVADTLFLDGFELPVGLAQSPP